MPYGSLRPKDIPWSPCHDRGVFYNVPAGRWLAGIYAGTLGYTELGRGIRQSLPADPLHHRRTDMSQEGSMMTTEYATRLRARLVILQEMLQLGSGAFRLDIAEQLALARARLGENQ